MMRKCIVVLGMHRSGTSALMGVLSALGIDLGSDLMNPKEDNPKGYFENMGIFELNERMLKSLDSSWDDPYLLPENWWNQEYYLNDYKKEGVEIIETEFKDADIFGIKDPRICRLLPFWKEIFKRRNIKPYFIIILRNPLEIANSLKERDGFSHEKSMLLWMNHMLEAELHSRYCQRSFIFFDELLKNPEKTINNISDIFDIKFPKDYNSVKDNIEGFLEQGLKHHTFKADNVDKDLSELIFDYYHILLSLTWKEKISDEEMSKIDAIREKFLLFHRFFYNEDIRESKHAYIKDLKTVIKDRDTHIGNIEAALNDRETVIRGKDNQIGNLEADVKDSAAVIKDRDNQIGNLESAVKDSAAVIKDRDTHIGNIESALRDKDAHIDNLEAVIGDKDTHIGNLQGSVRQKEEHIGNLVAAVRGKDVHIGNLENIVREKEAYIQFIQSGHGWRLLTKYFKVRDWLLPEESRRRKIMKFLWRLPHILNRQDLRKERLTQMILLIKASHLFDEQYYLEQNPNLAVAGIDPLLHFVTQGYREGRKPNPLFDCAFYLDHNPDVVCSKLHPLEHYIQHGAHEGCATSEQFDTKFYIETYLDVAASGMNPLEHFLQVGQHEGRLTVPVPDSGADETEISANEPAILLNVEELKIDFDSVAATNTRLIAFYLPQFHPISENDRWWGKGFTEWTNVTRAERAFADHDQPKYPADFGYYDLRVQEVREQQAEMARQYGIYGFCYHYYWFNGRRLLNRPLDEVIQSGVPDFPFCICWANENWTRRWDGLDQEILIKQKHSLASDLTFIEDVIPILEDPRYIRVDGKPLLIIYRAELLQNPKETAEVWRDACKRAGVGDIYLCGVLFQEFNPKEIGFNAAIEFPPHCFPAPEITKKIAGLRADFQGKIMDYAAGARNLIQHPLNADFRLYRGVMPGWDNTARCGLRATIFVGNTPEMYEAWLHSAINYKQPDDGSSDNLVFINAWNEWAEGTMLEPNQRDIRAYLEATARALINKTLVNKNAISEPVPLDRQLKQVGDPTISQKSTLTTAEHTIRWRMRPGHDSKSTKRTILFVSHDAARNGSQLLLLETIRFFKDLDLYEPYVILIDGGVVEADFFQVGNCINLQDFVPQLGSIDNVIEAVVRAVMTMDPVLAVCNTVVSSRVATALDHAGIPVLSIIHELVTSIDALFGRDTILEMVKHSRHVVVMSDFAKRALISHYHLPSSKFSIVHPGFRPHKEVGLNKDNAEQKFRKRLKLPEDAQIVLGCGTVYHRKGPDIFISLGRQYITRRVDTKTYFIWVGGGLDPEYIRWCEHDISSFGMRDRIRFVGSLDDTEEAFAASNIFVLTSREDPFPLVVLEAMSRGMPVIAFEGAGGAPEAIGSDAGKVVPYLDISAMEEALHDLLTDSLMYQKIAERARRRAEERYSMQAFFNGLKNVIRNNYNVEL